MEISNGIETEGEHEIERRNAEKELVQIRREVAEVFEASKGKLLEKEEHIQKLEKLVEGKQCEIQELQDLFEAEKEKSVKLQAEIEKEQLQITEEYGKIVELLREEMNERTKEVENCQTEAQSQIDHLCSLLKRNEAKYKKELVQSRQRLKELEENINTGNDSPVEERESALETRASQLQRELDECKSKFSAILIENRLLQHKISNYEETQQRNRSLFELQMKMKLATMEADSTAQIDKLQKEFNSSRCDFLTNICCLFREFSDCGDAITDDNVMSLLTKVNKLLNALLSEKRQYEQALSELSIIRNALGVPENARLYSALNDLNLVLQKQRAALEGRETEGHEAANWCGVSGKEWLE
jgi:DNA repair exonuclease SbcCD ATPase subunit